MRAMTGLEGSKRHKGEGPRWGGSSSTLAGTVAVQCSIFTGGECENGEPNDAMKVIGIP
jgi:hypothetical protein